MINLQSSATSPSFFCKLQQLILTHPAAGGINASLIPKISLPTVVEIDRQPPDKSARRKTTLMVREW
ncbi:MAG: hypothetical protein ACYC4N_04675 [Pirellulaceae bacterium]